MPRFRLSTSRTTLLALALTAVCGPDPASAEPETIQSLEVHASPRGGVVARATLHLTAPPAMVQAVLTDYERWPELFVGGMRVARVERYPGRAVTDVYLTHAMMPGERRLLCENRELPDGLVTTLLGGDFKRYARTWKVSSDGTATGTKAEFELEVEVDTLAPDWLVARVLKQELEIHFRALNSKADERARRTIGH